MLMHTLTTWAADPRARAHRGAQARLARLSKLACGESDG
jgi:hypothetical protein